MKNQNSFIKKTVLCVLTTGFMISTVSAQTKQDATAEEAVAPVAAAGLTVGGIVMYKKYNAKAVATDKTPLTPEEFSKQLDDIANNALSSATVPVTEAEKTQFAELQKSINTNIEKYQNTFSANQKNIASAEKNMQNAKADGDQELSKIYEDQINTLSNPEFNIVKEASDTAPKDFAAHVQSYNSTIENMRSQIISEKVVNDSQANNLGSGTNNNSKIEETEALQTGSNNVTAKVVADTSKDVNNNNDTKLKTEDQNLRTEEDNLDEDIHVDAE